MRQAAIQQEAKQQNKIFTVQAKKDAKQEEDKLNVALLVSQLSKAPNRDGTYETSSEPNHLKLLTPSTKPQTPTVISRKKPDQFQESSHQQTEVKVHDVQQIKTTNELDQPACELLQNHRGQTASQNTKSCSPIQQNREQEPDHAEISTKSQTAVKLLEKKTMNEYKGLSYKNQIESSHCRTISSLARQVESSQSNLLSNNSSRAQKTKMSTRNYINIHQLVNKEILLNKPKKQSEVLQIKNRKKEQPVSLQLIPNESMIPDTMEIQQVNQEDFQSSESDEPIQSPQRLLEKVTTIKGIQLKQSKISPVLLDFGLLPTANALIGGEGQDKINESDEEGDISIEAPISRNIVPAIHTKTSIQNQTTESNQFNYESQEYIQLKEQIRKESHITSQRSPQRQESRVTALSDPFLMNNGFILPNEQSEDQDHALSDQEHSCLFSEKQLLQKVLSNDGSPEQIVENNGQDHSQGHDEDQYHRETFFQLKTDQRKTTLTEQPAVTQTNHQLGDVQTTMEKSEKAENEQNAQLNKFEDLFPDISWNKEDVVSGTVPRIMEQTSFDLKQGLLSATAPRKQESKLKKTFDFQSNLKLALYSKLKIKTQVQSKDLNKHQMILKMQLKQADFDPVAYLQSHFIICRKYNYQILNTDSYHAKLGLSQDGKYLILEKVTISKHGCTVLGHEKNALGIQHCSKLPLRKITGFMYGGMSTRFQMQRQGILQIISQLQNKRSLLIDQMLPHFEWECLSIQFQNKDLDIVIKDELQMEVLIKLLISNLNTFDGNRNSINFLHEQKLLPKKVTVKNMMNRISFGYKLMKFRMKLAFESCKRCRTVQEHIIKSIIETYYERKDQGLIEDPYPPIDEKAMEEMMKCNLVEIKITNAHKSREQMVLELKGSRNKVDKMGSLMKAQSLMFKSKRSQSTHRPKAVGIEELFKGIIDNQEPPLNLTKMEREVQVREIVLRKKKVSQLFTQIQKLRLVIKLNMVHGPAFCILLLEIIRLQKLHFVTQLQDGNERDVPHAFLDRNKIPMSFHYYDWVYMLIKQNVDSHQKDRILRKCLSVDGRLPKKTDSDQANEHHYTENNQKPDELSFQERFRSKFERAFKQKPSSKKGTIYQARKKEDRVSARIFEQDKFFQSGNFIKINHKHLNKQMLDLKHVNNADVQDKDPDFFLSQEYHGQFEKLMENRELFSENDPKCLKNPNILEEYDIDLQYLTSKQVKQKRLEFFKKKLLFQAQLLNLKEKGKRLMKIQQLRSISVNAEDSLINQVHHQRQKQVMQFQLLKLKRPNDDLRLQDDQEEQEKLYATTKKLWDVIDKFSQSSIAHQEQAKCKQRKKLIKDLKSCEHFVQMNEVLDKMIVFDQRFFNKDYDKFQMMVSDVRKQIRLNEDILKIKQRRQKYVKQIGEEMITRLKLQKDLISERLQNLDKNDKNTMSIQKGQQCKNVINQLLQLKGTEKQQQQINQDGVGATDENDQALENPSDDSKISDFDIIGKPIDVPVMQTDPKKLKKLIQMKMKKQNMINKSNKQNLRSIATMEEKMQKRRDKIQMIGKFGQKGYQWDKNCTDHFEAQLHKAIGEKFEKLFEKEEEELAEELVDQNVEEQKEESIDRLTKSLFLQYDTSNDNFLDYNETKIIFQEIFEKQGIQRPWNEKIFQRIFDKFDADGSGFIGRTEMNIFISGLISSE